MAYPEAGDQSCRATGGTKHQSIHSMYMHSFVDDNSQNKQNTYTLGLVRMKKKCPWTDVTLDAKSG